MGVGGVTHSRWRPEEGEASQEPNKSRMRSDASARLTRELRIESARRRQAQGG